MFCHLCGTQCGECRADSRPRDQHLQRCLTSARTCRRPFRIPPTNSLPSLASAGPLLFSTTPVSRAFLAYSSYMCSRLCLIYLWYMKATFWPTQALVCVGFQVSFFLYEPTHTYCYREGEWSNSCYRSLETRNQTRCRHWFVLDLRSSCFQEWFLMSRYILAPTQFCETQCLRTARC